MRPDIGAMVRHEQGNIADQPDFPGGAASPQLLPLLGELPLDELMVTHLPGEVFFRAKNGFRLARSQFLVPSRPIRGALLLLDGREQGKILQPVRFRARKGVEPGGAAAVTVFLEIFECHG